MQETENLQEKTADLLLSMGYQYLPLTSGVEGRYIMEEGTARVVLCIELTSELVLSAGQLQNLQHNLRELFLHPQGRIPGCEHNMVIYDVPMLTLLLTTDADRARELCTACQNVWLMDEASHRLVIYENQPGSFFGLEKELSELAEAGEAWKGTGRTSWNTDGRITAGKPAFKDRVKNLSIVNLTIIAINLLVFFVLFLMGDTESGVFIAEHGGLYPPYVLERGEWWRIVTAMFLHFGVDHLANNMLILLFIGDAVERTVGRVRYLIIYLASGLCGGLLSLTMMAHLEDWGVAAGASGAIFGVIGALLWMVIRNRGRLENFTTRRLILMIALSLYFGFTSTGVDNWCHVGGLMSGFLLSVLLYRRKD